MATDMELIEKREELKRRLAAGEYKTLIDVLLEGTSRIIQKFSRSPRPISPWYSSMVLYLIIQSVSFTILVVIGDKSTLELFGDTVLIFTEIVLLNLAVGYLFIPGVIIGNFFIHQVFKTFQDSVLDVTEL